MSRDAWNAKFDMKVDGHVYEMRLTNVGRFIAGTRIWQDYAGEVKLGSVGSGGTRQRHYLLGRFSAVYSIVDRHISVHCIPSERFHVKEWYTTEPVPSEDPEVKDIYGALGRAFARFHSYVKDDS